MTHNVKVVKIGTDLTPSIQPYPFQIKVLSWHFYKFRHIYCPLWTVQKFLFFVYHPRAEHLTRASFLCRYARYLPPSHVCCPINAACNYTLHCCSSWCPPPAAFSIPAEMSDWPTALPQFILLIALQIRVTDTLGKGPAVRETLRAHHSRNLASTRAPSATVEATTPLWAHSASCRSTRCTGVLLVDWWLTQIRSAPGVTARLGPLWQTSYLSGCQWHHAWCGAHFLLHETVLGNSCLSPLPGL